jgi:hypothetical protein
VRLFLLIVGTTAATTGTILIAFGIPAALPLAAIAAGITLIRHASNLEGGRL